MTSRHMKSVKSRRVLSMGLTLCVLCVLGTYLYSNRDDIVRLTIVSPAYFGLCVLGLAGSWIGSAMLQQVMVRKFEVRIGFVESLGLAIVTSAVNLFAPLQSGAGLRAVYLKRIHGLSYGRFVATLYGFYVLLILGNSLLASASIAWISVIECREGMSVVLSAAVLCLIASVLAAFLPRFRLGAGWISRNVSAVLDGWHTLRKDLPCLAQMTAIAVVQIGANLAILWGAYESIGIHLNLPELAAVGSLAGLSMVLSLTPGNLGINEAVVAFTGSTLGVDAAQGVVAALICRAVTVVLLLILAPSAAYYLSWRQRFRSPELSHEPQDHADHLPSGSLTDTMATQECELPPGSPAQDSVTLLPE